MIFYQSERRYPLPPSVFFCTPPLFNSSLCSWFEIVSFVRKCKNLAEMVIICKDMGCFMLALFYLENLMGDFQYKMWLPIRVREGMPHPQCFSVHLLFIFYFLKLNWNCVFCEKMWKSCLNGNYLQRYMMFYVGTSLLRKFDGWYSI